MTKSPRGTIYVNKTFSNVSQDVIEITVDRLTLILQDYLNRIEANCSWHTPLALLVAIVLTLCTTKFKDAFGMSAEKWGAIFIIAAILVLVWFIKTLLKCRKSPSIPEIIAKIKEIP